MPDVAGRGLGCPGELAADAGDDHVRHAGLGDRHLAQTSSPWCELRRTRQGYAEVRVAVVGDPGGEEGAVALRLGGGAAQVSRWLAS